MSRHIGAGSGAPNIPRSAAERRVLEQLQAQSAFPTRRTLPRPAATSPLPASDALIGASDTRVRRPRSRILGAAAASVDGEASLLQDILDEFPEIDHTTVSVLLSMHNGRRSPVVQRLAEVYRVPGKPPQKRHSFPSSAHRGVPTQRSRPQSARTRRPFSVDRIDDDDDDEEIPEEETLPLRSHGGETPSATRSAGVPSKAPLPHTANSAGRRQPTSRKRRDDASLNSQSSSNRSHHRRSRRRRGDTNGFGSEGDDPASRTSATSPRYEERASEPLLAPWGQEHAPRARGDTAPPVTLPPAILRSRSIGSPGTQPPFTLLHSAHTPVFPEESAVRLHARLFAHDNDQGGQGAIDEEGSVSSSGTSSNTRGSPAASSARSSARSSVPSSTRGGSAQTVSTRDGRDSDLSHRDGRESTRAAAAAVLRGVVGGHRSASARQGTETVGGAVGLSRRQRGARSVRNLSHVVLDGLSRSLGTRESGSEDDADEGARENRPNGYGEMEEYGRDERIERAVEYADGSEDATLRTVGIPELLLLRGDTSEVSGGAAEGSDGGGSGYVRVEISILQGLVRKLDVAERALGELQHENKERVAELLRAVSTVSSSLSHYDERQQKRFDTLRAVFNVNNDSIERLTYSMLSIRSELRDYETRRSRRFWRMIGLKVLDLLAYVALGLVWLCASVYNLGARQRRALTRLVQGDDDEEKKNSRGFKRHASFEAAEVDAGEQEVDEDDRFGAMHRSEYESAPSDQEIVESEDPTMSSDEQ